jgi:hypothetical protein
LILYLDTSSLVKRHLASCLLVAREFPGEEVRFSSADRQLVAAARRAREGRRRR